MGEVIEAPSMWTKKKLVRLCWPLVIEQLLAVTVGMVDMVMVSSVGEAAMSGISLVDSINFLLISLFSSMATGGAVVCSQYMGRQDPEKASEAARQLVYVVVSISTVLMTVSLVFRQPLLSLIYGHIEADVMQNAVTYMTVTAISFPFLALYNGGAALFRSMGNSRVSMMISIVMNLMNVAGNAITIYGLGWGVFGASLSTLISRTFAAVFITWLLCTPSQGPIHLRGLFRVRIQMEHVRSITRIGLPNGLEGSIFQVGKILVSRVISSFGTPAIAANAAANVLGTFLNIPGNGIALAMVTVVGQNMGAKNPAAAKRDVKRMMLVIHGAMIVLGALMMVLRGPLVSLFNLTDAAKAIAEQCLFITAIFTPLLWPPSFGLPNALRATGDTKFTMVSSIFSMWVFRIGFAYLFAQYLGWGVPGVWLAMVVDWLMRTILFTTRWASGRWQQQRVIEN